MERDTSPVQKLGQFLNCGYLSSDRLKESSTVDIAKIFQNTIWFINDNILSLIQLLLYLLLLWRVDFKTNQEIDCEKYNVLLLEHWLHCAGMVVLAFMICEQDLTGEGQYT